MKKTWIWILLALVLLGLAASLISTQQTIKIALSGIQAKSFCSISPFVDCDVVQSSGYARLLGAPVAWWGFLHYLWLLSILVGVLLVKRELRGMLTCVWLSSIGVFLYTGYKAYLSFAVLQALCLTCLAMYVVNLATLLGFTFLTKGRREYSVGFAGAGVLLAFIFFMGIPWILSVEARGTKREKIDVADAVELHFRSSSYALEVDPASPMWGEVAGNVTVVEFSDFQCPFCREAAIFVRPALMEFRNRLKFYFIHYPLDQSCNPYMQNPGHPFACKAAYAATCAQKFGDFWGYHDDLFINQNRIQDDFFLDLATKRGWGKGAFIACMDSQEVKNKVAADIALAQKLGIGATPTILINDRRVKYWMYPEVIKGIVLGELNRR